jgi:RNase P subunit RPR2
MDALYTLKQHCHQCNKIMFRQVTVEIRGYESQRAASILMPCPHCLYMNIIQMKQPQKYAVRAEVGT